MYDSATGGCCWTSLTAASVGAGRPWSQSCRANLTSNVGGTAVLGNMLLMHASVGDASDQWVVHWLSNTDAVAVPQGMAVMLPLQGSAALASQTQHAQPACLDMASPGKL